MVGSRASRISLFSIFNYILMVVIAMVTVYPIVHIVAVSFSDTVYIVQSKITIFPRGFNIEAYKEIFSSEKVPRAYLNTILYTGTGTTINLLMTAIAAYPLSRSGFFGRKYFMILIVLTMFLNGGIIPNYLIVQKLGMVDSIWALIIPNAIWTFELLILKSFYENMSESLRESAIMDGASELRVLFSIVIPLSKPALASIGLFYFMGHWNSFFLPLIYLNDVKLFPLQLVLRDMLIFDTAREANNMGGSSRLTAEAIKNATIFITMLPICMLYPLAQRYFAKGVMLGSEKG
ncbi:carbohydrate ABC transporter permease [Paenibacillus eucommiae]|uniref:Aldouronate transport system permease protein n=1 Tax=Paenibacillus eucommiae TaxID=1355755 RepID=A0ABS4JAJ0_9BACL|nr:carbohydrate ABC transporter permease [Paenibacillus eucommiae]MBP1995759.1 putative aldouronate transport system permease protein [Paenibacillus eucommiae]